MWEYCPVFSWGGGWMAGHFLWGFLLLAGVVLLVWSIARPRCRKNSTADKRDSLEILKVRLAKGEISIEEYNTLKSML